MTNRRLKYLKNEVIEEITAKRIREYEYKFDTNVTFPVPIQKIVESILGLDFDWDIIEEKPGEQIMAGLIPSQKKIVMNERHLELFEEKLGLEQSTIGHEAGHWDIDIDHSKVNHPTFPGFELDSLIVNRKTEKKDLIVRVLKHAPTSNESYRFYKDMKRGLDAPEVKSAVDRYQSALLMPKWLIYKEIEGIDRTSWNDLYDLQKKAKVTISNLVVRLQRLGLIYIPKGSKKIYKSQNDYLGQKELF